MADLTLGNEKVTPKAVTLRQLFRLLALTDKVKDDLGLTQEDFKSVVPDAKGLAALIGHVVEVCVGQVDFSKPETELSPTAQLVLTELGRLVGVSADTVADAPIDELYAVTEAFWEANASGPLGQRIRSTIEGLGPVIQLAKDVTMMGFQKELIKVSRVGGTSVGGMTGSSSPSSESSSGDMQPSTMTSPPEKSSSTTPVSAITEDSKLQSSARQPKTSEKADPQATQAPE